MRAKTSITPPVRASAPPESPVPAPRPTIGTWYFAASFTIAETSGGGARENDQIGQGLFHRPVVFEKQKIIPLVKHVGCAQ